MHAAITQRKNSLRTLLVGGKGRSQLAAEAVKPGKNSWVLSPRGGSILVGLNDISLCWKKIGGLVVDGKLEELTGK